MTPKAHFNPDIFLSTVNRKGLAKQNRFEVHIYFPRSFSESIGIGDDNLISLFCEGATLPQQSIGVKQQKIYGPAYQRPVSVDYGGEGIPMTFLLDANMNVKSVFDIWISKIVDPIQYFVYHPSSYVAQIKIMQLDEDDNIVYTCVLEDAFPRNVSQLELSHSSQNQVHKLNVTFAYRRWFPVSPLNEDVTYPGLNLLKRDKDTGIRVSQSIRNTQNALESVVNSKTSADDLLKRKLNR